MDKRRLNGGNSTKSKGVDKRKNKYLQLLNEAITDDDIIKVIQKLKDIALNKSDVSAIKLFLEYCLGKPKETVENINHTIDNSLSIEEILMLKEEILNEY